MSESRSTKIERSALANLLMTVLTLDCYMGDKTEKEKHKKDLQRERNDRLPSMTSRKPQRPSITPYPDIPPPLITPHLLAP
ncbi:MAG TPA: hypothetical protein VIT23_08685 [Terrimicrobiaceae bacterium]